MVRRSAPPPPRPPLVTDHPLQNPAPTGGSGRFGGFRIPARLSALTTSTNKPQKQQRSSENAGTALRFECLWWSVLAWLPAPSLRSKNQKNKDPRQCRNCFGCMFCWLELLFFLVCLFFVFLLVVWVLVLFAMGSWHCVKKSAKRKNTKAAISTTVPALSLDLCFFRLVLHLWLRAPALLPEIPMPKN